MEMSGEPDRPNYGRGSKVNKPRPAPAFDATASPTSKAAMSMTANVMPPNSQPTICNLDLSTTFAPELPSRQRGSLAPAFHNSTAATMSAANNALTIGKTSIVNSLRPISLML